MQQITPFLWFDSNAEQGVDFYLSVFPEGKKLERMTGPDGKVITQAFSIRGTNFTAMNGGPHVCFNESISFVVSCKDQQEVDYYWEKLGERGQYSMCGWLTDRFGISWQITPDIIPQVYLGDPEAAKRTFDAMMQMQKLDIAALQAAYDGK